MAHRVGSELTQECRAQGNALFSMLDVATRSLGYQAARTNEVESPGCRAGWRIALDSSHANAIARRLGTDGIGRRSLAKAAGSWAIAGLVTLPGVGRAVAARQGKESDHPAIVALGTVLIDAAAELRVSVDEITVQSLQAHEWPDGCLGLDLPGQACTEAITPGYRIVLGPPAGNSTYRTDQHGTIQRETAGDVQEAIHVRYEISGGIAGIRDVFEVDTADLPEVETEELRRLIEAADFWSLPERIDDGGQIVDGLDHTVVVTEGSRQHTVSLISSLGSAESHYPSFLALLGWLRGRMESG